jgi:hypothetical protein
MISHDSADSFCIANEILDAQELQRFPLRQVVPGQVQLKVPRPIEAQPLDLGTVFLQVVQSDRRHFDPLERLPLGVNKVSQSSEVEFSQLRIQQKQQEVKVYF